MTAKVLALATQGTIPTPSPSPSPTPTPTPTPTPSPSPTGVDFPDYDFVLTSALPAGAVFTRASLATVVNANGQLVQLGNDMPRFEYRYNLAGSAIPLGIALEPQRTNLVARAAALDNAKWGKNVVTITPDQSVGPEGQQTMDELTNGASTFNEVFQGVNVTAGLTYALSAYAKFGSIDDFIVMQISDQNGIYGGSVFNLANGTVGNPLSGGGWQVLSASMEPMANNIYRLKATLKAPLTQATNVGFYLQSINAQSPNTFAATQGATGFVTDVQLEANADVTSFIPNATDNSVTREADSLTVPMDAATYDILVEDIDGGEWRNAVVIPAATAYTVTPRNGKRHVKRVRAWNTATNPLTQDQKDQLVPPAPPPPGGNILFASRYDGTVALSAVQGNDGNIGFEQDITGQDAAGDSTWPVRIWGAQTSYIQINTGTPQNLADVGNFVQNELVSMARHDGTTGTVLHQKLLQAGTQDPYYQADFTAPIVDLYVKFWMKLPADIKTQMGVNSWLAYFELKTDGDFRWINFIYTDPNGNLLWHTQTDTNANGGLPFEIFTQDDNTIVAVPVDEWFMVECFAHRSSGTDGRLLTRINGQTLFDFAGPNYGQNNLPWDRILGPQIYGGNAGVMEMWVDDVEFRDALPLASPSPSPSPTPSPTPTPTPTPGPTPTGHDKPGWNLTFLDDFEGVMEFDATRGKDDLYFDRTKWTPGFIPVAFGQDNGGDGSHYLAGNGEQEDYQYKDFAGNGVPPERRINPFYIHDSLLEIEVGYIPDDLQPLYWVGDFRVFYSGVLTTANKFSQQYGLFEMRAKMFPGLGAWPAFWFLSQPATLDQNHWPPEIDCLEQFPKLRPTQTHAGAIRPDHSAYGDWHTMPNGSNVNDGFHIYSLEWNADTITWSVDGVVVQSGPNVCFEPCYILVNVAVGGYWYAGESGHGNDLYALVNDYRANPSQMPYRAMIVDWVRAYTKA